MAVPTLGLTVAQDIVNAALDFYIKGPALAQTKQRRPLLALMEANKKTFPGGKQYISTPVQGNFMSDGPVFAAGFIQDDQLQFSQSSNILRAKVPYYLRHAGLVITIQELIEDGISVSDRGETSQHSEADVTRLTGILENRLEDFGESWARSMNLVLWKDGSADAKDLAGLTSILTDSATVGLTEGLDRGTYPWWRHRVNLAVQASPQNQTLTKFFRNEVIQLKRFNGMPSKILCGSRAWDGIMQEVSEKGYYTQTGFAKGTDVGIGQDDLSIKGIGKFEYDPTMDDLGFSSRFYVLDTKHFKLQPIEGEDEKLWKPERPYNYLVLLRSMTWMGGLIFSQLNGNGVYQLA